MRPASARRPGALLLAAPLLAVLLAAQAVGAPAASAATQGLSLTATATPTSVSRVGQQVDYAVAVRNRGDQSVRDLLVSAPVPGQIGRAHV